VKVTGSPPIGPVLCALLESVITVGLDRTDRR